MEWPSLRFVGAHSTKPVQEFQPAKDLLEASDLTRGLKRDSVQENLCVSSGFGNL